MNLALRDVRHNAFRFVLTALGLGGLLGIVVAMAGIYAGALDDALRLPRASSPDLWVVQPLTKGSVCRTVTDSCRHARIGPPHPRRRRGRRCHLPDGADDRKRQAAAAVHPGLRGRPSRWSERAGIRPRDHASHYQIVADISSGLRLGDQVPLGPYRDTYTVVGLTKGMVTSSGDPVAWLTLLDAQDIQFSVAPPLQRRERAAGRSPLVTADINAVLGQPLSGRR